MTWYDVFWPKCHNVVICSLCSRISVYNELCTTIRLMEMLNLRNAKEYSSERINSVTFDTVGEKI
jgi:hypothetical protein